MNQNISMNEKQIDLLTETIRKNGWCLPTQDVRVEVWSKFDQAPDLLKNYLCKDGSGYVRGYYDGVGIFYVMRYHLRDEEWRDSPSAPV